MSDRILITSIKFHVTPLFVTSSFSWPYAAGYRAVWYSGFRVASLLFADDIALFVSSDSYLWHK